MRGELTFKVRSTPTPERSARTVIERVMPPPRRRMTVPSKTWMRSRLPSTTLAETRTVSPDASSGRSLRIWSAVISSRTFTGRYSLAGQGSGGGGGGGGGAAPGGGRGRGGAPPYG